MNTDPDTLDSVPDPQIVYLDTFYLVLDLQIVYPGNSPYYVLALACAVLLGVWAEQKV